MDGNVLDVGHIGYGEDNTQELLYFYEKVLGLENVMSYGIDHPYVGRINGVTDCLYDIGFLRCFGEEHRMELVGCVNAVRGDARYPFGTGGHMHFIFTTDQIDACRSRLTDQGVRFQGETAAVDYGCFAGRKAFYIYDINGVCSMIAENGKGQKGSGKIDSLAGVSYTVTEFNGCRRLFESGLGLQTEDMRVSESRFLRELCQDDDMPTRAFRVLFNEPQRFFSRRFSRPQSPIREQGTYGSIPWGVFICAPWWTISTWYMSA